MAIDKELAAAVKQALAGEEHGFNYIYNETYSYVFSRCRMIMKNDDDASELLQETYIAAYKSLDKLSDVNSIFSWLGSIAYNQGMKMFRKRKDVLLDEDGEGLFEVQENVDVSTIPGHEMEIKEIAGIIKDIIDELPETQRAVVMAYYYDEMSVNDIAAAMEVSAGTVKSRLNYARKHIEEAVNTKEKQLGIKLHTLVAPVLCTALGLRLSAVAISENTAKKLYAGICAKSGIAALSALEATGSGALSSSAAVSAGGSVSAATGSATGGAAASAGSNAAAGAIAEGVSGVTSVAAGKAAGATLVSTLVKAAAAIVLVGAGTAGVIYYTTHKDNRSDSTDKIEATTEVMNNISDSTKDNVTDADDKASVSSDDNNSSGDVTDKTSGKDNETGSNGTDNASGNTSGNAADGTTGNASTEDESVEDPNIEAVEQEGATTRATTQATTQQKTENKSAKKQEVEFDDMEF